MKEIKIIFCVIIFLQLSVGVFPQVKELDNIGIGISIDPSTIGHQLYYYNSSPNIIQAAYAPILFYIPIKYKENIGIEPFFGLNSGSEQIIDNYTSSNGFNNSTSTIELNAMTIGVRVYYYKTLLKMLGIYVGPKVALNFQSLTQQNESSYNYAGQVSYQNNKTETKETDFILGIIFGCEYFPISHFSIGGEASFNYTSYGNPTITKTNIPPPQNNSSETVERNFHSFHTDGIVFIRWYFL